MPTVRIRDKYMDECIYVPALRSPEASSMVKHQMGLGRFGISDEMNYKTRRMCAVMINAYEF